MASSEPGTHVDAVRRFNRFYTKKIGVLHDRLLRSPFSLTEARVLWELAQGEETTATELGRDLDLDPGHLSRILRRLRERRLVDRRPSENDARRSQLWLTRRGREAFAKLDAAQSREIETMLAELEPERRERLARAMSALERLLGATEPEAVPYVLRPPRAGDMGWVVQRHGALYAREHAFDERFEALVAEIVGQFLRRFDPKSERCWIAEREGENVGSIFLTRKSKKVAQLRLLLVEPRARGLGIGTRLVDECIRFARDRGYRKIVLWTQDNLHAARRIYERVGFRLVREEEHDSFGHDLVAQTWERAL